MELYLLLLSPWDPHALRECPSQVRNREAQLSEEDLYFECLGFPMQAGYGWVSKSSELLATLGRGFKYFLFSPLFWEDFQFD